MATVILDTDFLSSFLKIERFVKSLQLANTEFALVDMFHVPPLVKALRINPVRNSPCSGSYPRS